MYVLLHLDWFTGGEKPDQTRDPPCHVLINEAMGARTSIQAYSATEFFEERHRAVLSKAMAGIASATLLRRLLNAMQAGLTLSLSITLAKHLDAFLWSLINLDVEMNSMERLNQYLTLPTPETDHSSRCQGIAPSWPERGSVVFSEVSVTYAQASQPSLVDFDLAVPAAASWAEADAPTSAHRPGSGKSTMIAALLGLVPLTTGTIWIDDADLAAVSLHQRRRAVHVLAQDTVLFEGTLRQNLDPSRHSKDADMLETLTAVGWHPHEAGFNDVDRPSVLDQHILAGGTNLSAGQAQFVALARRFISSAALLPT